MASTFATTDLPNAAAIARFIDRLQRDPLPAEVLDAAKQCALDWFAVCLAGRSDPQACAIAELIHGWRSHGAALAIDGRSGAAGPMALVNATLSHTLDFDDFHLDSLHHASGPTFAAAFALGLDRERSGADILAAFVAGFEVGTQLGLGGTGMKLAQQGWHPTCILGHFSATTACAALLRLDASAIERALGFAAVQAGGLMAAAGTISKAFVVGKAAMTGVMAAELAEQGALAPANLLDIGPPGLFATLFQGEVVPRIENLGRAWQITGNTYKPYPACQLTHASFDAAQALSGRIEGQSVRKVRAFVNPFALTIAKYRDPKTPLEARFSLNYCIGLGLLGHRAALADFSDERLADATLLSLSRIVETVADETIARWASKLEVTFENGDVVTEVVAAALGSRGRPMGWPELEAKFLMVAEPVMGKRAPALLGALRDFDRPGALDLVVSIVSSARSS